MNRLTKPSTQRERARLMALNKVLKEFDRLRKKFPDVSNNKLVITIACSQGLNNNTVRGYLREAGRIEGKINENRD